jgi:cytoskeletal protein RodZ
MSENSSSSGKTAAVVIGMVVVIVAALGAFYWFVYKPQQEAEEQARLEQIKQEEAERKRQEELAEKKSQYEDLIKQADAEFDQENWQAAQSLYSQASSLLPDQQYAKDRLATVNSKLQEIADKEARRQAGIIEQISTPTGRHHIIVSSSIDDDLAMDYAKKLAQEGYNVKIIEHNAEKNLYYRVSVGDFETREEAESQIPSFSSLEGELWVLRY